MGAPPLPDAKVVAPPTTATVEVVTVAEAPCCPSAPTDRVAVSSVDSTAASRRSR